MRKCSAELVAEGAADAPSKGQSIRALMQDAHKKSKIRRSSTPISSSTGYGHDHELGLSLIGFRRPRTSPADLH
jgi:hypothetical protein